MHQFAALTLLGVWKNQCLVWIGYQADEQEKTLLRAVPQLCDRALLAGLGSTLSWGSHRGTMFLKKYHRPFCECRSDGGRMHIQDKLQCTLAEGWEVCWGFQKCSDVLVLLLGAAGMPGGSQQHILCFQISWCDHSWLRITAQVQEPNWFAWTLVTEQVFKT